MSSGIIDPQPNIVQSDIFTFLPIVGGQPVTDPLPTPVTASALPPLITVIPISPAPAAPVTQPPPPPPPLPPPPAASSSQLVGIDDVCGISNFTSTRVVGGSNAKLSNYHIF